MKQITSSKVHNSIHVVFVISNNLYQFTQSSIQQMCWPMWPEKKGFVRLISRVTLFYTTFWFHFNKGADVHGTSLWPESPVNLLLSMTTILAVDYLGIYIYTCTHTQERESSRGRNRSHHTQEQAFLTSIQTGFSWQRNHNQSWTMILHAH